MKRRRPTIPLAEWKIAVDLAGTRAVQEQPGTPAYACTCRLCSEWRLVHAKAIPDEVYSQLQRIGIVTESPTDLYGSGKNLESRIVRITYHLVGKILSGPEAYAVDNQRGFGYMNYRELRKEPWFTIRVLPDSESYEPSPTFPQQAEKNGICVDIRLEYPAYLLDAKAERRENA